MKKGILLIGIITWTMVMALVIVSFVITVKGEWANILNFNTVLVKEDVVDAQGLNNIDIEGDYNNVELVSTTDSQIKVHQYGKSNLDATEFFNIELNGQTAKIKATHKDRIFNIDFLNDKLIVEVPTSLNGDFNMNLNTGNVKLNDTFNWKNTNISSHSGNISIEQPLFAENLNINAYSGKISAKNAITVTYQFSVINSSGKVDINVPIKADDFNVDVTSGLITLGEVEASKFNLNNSSGSMNVMGITGSGSANVLSGKMNIELNNPIDNINLFTKSGSMNITVDESLDFNFDGKCSSGTIHANFPVDTNEKGSEVTAKVGSNPVASIIARCTSGSIKINKQ